MIGPINKNMPDFLASDPDAGYFSQFLLHHPFNIDSQPAINNKDIVLALMVRDDNIGLRFDDIISSRNVDQHRRQTAVEARPYRSADEAGYPGIRDNGQNHG
jgi:hypothetical protein